MTFYQLNAFINRKPWAALLLTFFLGGLFVYMALASKSYLLASGTGSAGPEKYQHLSAGYTVCQPGNFQNIKPLAKEVAAEASEFMPLKKDLTILVDSLKRVGAVSQVSVYLREFDHRGWMAVNKEERYHPASLMKVAVLMCYLKMAELDPGLLRRELVYNKPAGVEINAQYFQAPTIQPGNKYTVHDLLYYMMAYSDNHAAWLLGHNFDNALLKKLFADFCLPEPVEDNKAFTMTAKECAVLFKAIYSSSYLSPEYSEYAAELMGNCSFSEGFVKGCPKNTKMWHKFGEWRREGYEYELHEAGVIFIDDVPYLLTVLTKGKDTDQLANAISIVARKVFNKLAKP